jgi:hypothetical protein
MARHCQTSVYYRTGILAREGLQALPCSKAVAVGEETDHRLEAASLLTRAGNTADRAAVAVDGHGLQGGCVISDGKAQMAALDLLGDGKKSVKQRGHVLPMARVLADGVSGCKYGR